jgi:hypothetical protein
VGQLRHRLESAYPLVAVADPTPMPSQLTETVSLPMEAGSAPIWSLADQATVSAGNFLTGWLLARSLPAAEFGTWAVLLGAMIFANSIHAALVTSPLCVKGSADTRRWARRFTGRSLIFAMKLAPLLLIPLVIACLSLHRYSLLPGVIGALVLWQFQETLRTGLLSQSRFRAAALGDAISYLGQAAGVVYCLSYGQRSLMAVFLVMSATSVLGGLIQSRQLHIRAHDFEPLEGYFSSCWELGRWWFYARLVGVFSSLAFPWALAMGQGPEQTATFQALLTVLALTNPVLFSINNLVLTRVARHRATCAGANTIAVALRSARTGFALIIPYLLLVFFCPQQVASVFYGSASPYLAQQGLLKILAFAYLMEAVSCVSLAILGGLQKTPFVFATQCVAAVIALLICLPAAYCWGPRYAAMGFACVVMVKALVSSFLVLRTLEQPVAIAEPRFQPHGFQLLVK